MSQPGPEERPRAAAGTAATTGEHAEIVEIRREAAGRSLTRAERNLIASIKRREETRTAAEEARRAYNRRKREVNAERQAAVAERNAAIGAVVAERFPDKSHEEILEMLAKAAE